MATNPTTTAAQTKNAADVDAVRKADDAAAESGVTAGAAATEEARARDAETLKATEEARPYPSQEEADAMKSTAAAGAAPYVTRQAKA